MSFVTTDCRDPLVFRPWPKIKTSKRKRLTSTMNQCRNVHCVILYMNGFTFGIFNFPALQKLRVLRTYSAAFSFVVFFFFCLAFAHLNCCPLIYPFWYAPLNRRPALCARMLHMLCHRTVSVLFSTFLSHNLITFTIFLYLPRFFANIAGCFSCTGCEPEHGARRKPVLNDVRPQFQRSHERRCKLCWIQEIFNVTE